MKFVFNAIYLLLLGIFMPWLWWRIVHQNKNRRGWGQKLFGLAPVRNSSCRCVWIHAVSVGEVNLLVPLIAQFRDQYPDFDIAISTTTETGFDLACQRFPDLTIFFCPTDFSWAVNNTIQRLQPDLLILTELELWPNLISITKRHGIPVALINGRVSEKSFKGYQRLGFLVRRFLMQLDLAVMQTDLYARRLRQLGMPANKVEVSGNIKFDCIRLRDRNENQTSAIRQLAQLANIEKDEFVFLAGSTQEEEDIMAISVYMQLQKHHPNLRLVLVPRHPERCDRIFQVLHQQKIPFLQRSALSENDLVEHQQKPIRPVLVIDVIGELGEWWSRANAGYVGGSMGNRGGQNMIEPAGLGVPICFGPNTENFKDVVDLLLDKQAATVVHNERELKEFVEFVLTNSGSARRTGELGRQLVASQIGATSRTISRLEYLISPTGLTESTEQKAA